MCAGRPPSVTQQYRMSRGNTQTSRDFQMSSKFVTMLSWGARLLYVGPSFNLKPHRSAISVFCIGLDGDLAITTNPAAPGDSWTRCRSVFVPAGLHPTIDFRAAAIGCLYVDPQSDDSTKLA